MELYKREENYKNPVKTAKINYFALGFLYIIIGAILFISKPIVGSVLIPLGIFLFVIAYLLGKKNIFGIYLGWLFIAVGFILSFVNLSLSSLVSFIIIAYLAFWNYKADKAMHGASVPKTTTDEQQPEKK